MLSKWYRVSTDLAYGLSRLPIVRSSPVSSDEMARYRWSMYLVVNANMHAIDCDSIRKLLQVLPGDVISTVSNEEASDKLLL